MATTTGSPGSARGRAGAQVNWIVLLIVGALAVLLGIFLLFSSTTATRILVEVVGIYWLIAGLVELLGLVGDRGAPMRLPRLIGSIAAVASGGLILLSMLLGEVIAPNLLRIVVALTALIMGVVNIVVGSHREAPARGRQILGVVYALLGIVLLVDPAAVPSFVIPIIGLLFVAAGAYAVYLAIKGREAGSVVLGIPGAPPSTAIQQQAMLNKAKQDVDQIAKQTKDADLGPNDGP